MVECSAEVIYGCSLRICGICKDRKCTSIVGIVSREAAEPLPREPLFGNAVAVALLPVPLVIYWNMS